VRRHHGSKCRVEVIGPGRQDRFFRTTILFQERLPRLWHRSSSLRQAHSSPSWAMLAR
jgi:hypothetical protein